MGLCVCLYEGEGKERNKEKPLNLVTEKEAAGQRIMPEQMDGIKIPNSNPGVVVNSYSPGREDAEAAGSRVPG